MSRCAMCREPFAICAVTYDADGDEICEDCDASLGPFRPSEDYVIYLLRSVARGETERTDRENLR